MFALAKPKCPIKKFKATKHISGNDLLVHENFQERVKSIDDVAKSCKVIVYIKGSYYQLGSPTQSVPYNDYDLVIGHGFQFQLRDESNAMLCNEICLSKSKTKSSRWTCSDSSRYLSLGPNDIAEVRCFLQGIANRGLVWSRLNSNVISDGTYSSNIGGYQTLKNDIQTRCKDEKLKRALLRTLRRMYAEELEGEDEE